MSATSLRTGDEVVTPRGRAIVVSVAGAPGAEVICVKIGSLTVDLAVRDVHGVVAPMDLAEVEAFLAPSAPESQLEAIEAFLAAPAVVQPPPLGRTRGAVFTFCSCACGQKKGCCRISTAPDIHREEVSDCRCANRGCECV